MSFTQELKEQVAQLWETGYKHPFLQEIGQGTLDKNKFKFYLVQDYLFLLEYAKVFAVAMTKATDETTLTQLAKIQHNILHDELKIHRKYLAQFDLAQKQVSEAKPALFNRTYAATMLTVAHAGDLAEIFAAVLPCSWIYYDYACRLKQQYTDRLMDNIYSPWIDAYASANFRRSFEWCFRAIDDLASEKDAAGKAKISAVFANSVECECLFWEMSYQQSLSLLP